VRSEDEGVATGRTRPKAGPRVAVAGGTGAVGRHVVAALAEAGAEPVVLARSAGVDLVTGQGLASAMHGVTAVIDVSNVSTQRRQTAIDFFTAATSRLLQAGRQAEVRQHVALSIVGVDRVDTGYYAGKRAQEQLVRSGPVPGSVLRATQFHEFVDQVLDIARGPIAPVPVMRIQPVAAREVATALAALALRPAPGPAPELAPELAGPEEHALPDLARRLLRARGQRRLVLPLRGPVAASRAVAAGALLPTGPGPRGTQTFDQWLATRQVAAVGEPSRGPG
jgi:uncharacterized protein YbjT (DUF2867 family)